MCKDTQGNLNRKTKIEQVLCATCNSKLFTLEKLLKMKEAY